MFKEFSTPLKRFHYSKKILVLGEYSDRCFAIKYLHGFDDGIHKIREDFIFKISTPEPMGNPKGNISQMKWYRDRKRKDGNGEISVPWLESK